MSLLIIRPKSGKFLKNYDTFGKMDPFLMVTFGNDMQKSDVAKNQGKTPVWTKVHTFEVSPTQASNITNLTVMFEAFDEDATEDEFIGYISIKLGQLKLNGEVNTVTLHDKKSVSVGTIDVEIEYIPGFSAPIVNELKVSQEIITTTEVKASKPPLAQRIIGTVILKPISGKLEASTGVNDNQRLYLVFGHHDVTYHSNVSEGTGKRPQFTGNTTFQQYDNEGVKVECFVNDISRDHAIGEGHINIQELTKHGFVEGHIVKLVDANGKLAGELNLDIEFTHDIVNNPVQAYDVIAIRRGESIPKKLKYYNPDKVRKNLKVKSENSNIILVKTETLTIPPGEFGEIKFKFIAPQNSKGSEETCKVNVVTEDARVEESLLFRVKAV